MINFLLPSEEVKKVQKKEAFFVFSLFVCAVLLVLDLINYYHDPRIACCPSSAPMKKIKEFYIL